MLRVTTKYEIPKRSVRWDRIADAAEPKLTNKCNSLADQLIALTNAELDNINASDEQTLRAIETFKSTLRRLDGGALKPRKKVVRGSLRQVSLVTTAPGGGYSAPKIEFGLGAGSPQYRPLAKAVYQMGGSVY